MPVVLYGFNSDISLVTHANEYDYCYETNGAFSEICPLSCDDNCYVTAGSLSSVMAL